MIRNIDNDTRIDMSMDICVEIAMDSKITINIDWGIDMQVDMAIAVIIFHMPSENIKLWLRGSFESMLDLFWATFE